mgnify:CR=1 FL=1
MSYTPPSNTSINGSLESYSPPNNTSIDAQLGKSGVKTKVFATTAKSDAISAETNTSIATTSETNSKSVQINELVQNIVVESLIKSITTATSNTIRTTLIGSVVSVGRTQATIIDGRSINTIFNTVATTNTQTSFPTSVSVLSTEDNKTNIITTTPAIGKTESPIRSITNKRSDTIVNISVDAPVDGGRTSTSSFDITEITDNVRNENSQIIPSYKLPEEVIYERETTETEVNYEPN